MKYRTVSLDKPGYQDSVVVANAKGEYVTNAQIQFGIFSFGSLDKAMVYTRDGGNEVVDSAKRYGSHQLRIVKVREEDDGRPTGKPLIEIL